MARGFDSAAVAVDA
uniref:Uncharacterized protein n=1 Tax=Arundo donax TaxID=35708 RepID=A0A0A9GYP6_ARUDO